MLEWIQKLIDRQNAGGYFVVLFLFLLSIVNKVKLNYANSITSKYVKKERVMPPLRKTFKYRYCSIKPPGVYFISYTSTGGGGLLERGLFTKSNGKDMYNKSSILLPRILRIQHTI